MAVRMIESFADSEIVVAPSASCAAMIKVHYEQLLEGHFGSSAASELATKTWEFSEFLVKQLKVTDVGARFPHKVTLHDGCHSIRELDIPDVPFVFQHYLFHVTNNSICFSLDAAITYRCEVTQ